MKTIWLAFLFALLSISCEQNTNEPLLPSINELSGGTITSDCKYYDTQATLNNISISSGTCVEVYAETATVKELHLSEQSTLKIQAQQFTLETGLEVEQGCQLILDPISNL